MQRRNCCCDQLCILIENADEHRREQRNQSPYEHGVAECDLRHKPDSAARALVQLCAVVIADGSRCAVRDSEHRCLRDLAHRIKHCHYADVQVAAEITQHGIAGYLHERIRKRHDKARHAQHRDALNAVPVRTKAAEIQPELGLSAGQETQHPRR